MHVCQKRKERKERKEKINSREFMYIREEREEKKNG